MIIRKMWILIPLLCMLFFSTFATTTLNAMYERSAKRPTIYNETAYLQQIQFSGYTFWVRNNPTALQGPGPNYFDQSLVRVDPNTGYLTLSIKKFPGNNWRCAEVWTTESFGYGTYQFVVDKFAPLDPNTVVGLFTYLNDNNELDIEFSRWGYPTAPNSAYTVQPWYLAGHSHSFNFSGISEPTVHQFTWQKDFVEYLSVTESGIPIAGWTFNGTGIPVPATEKVHMNFWLVGGNGPQNGRDTEITIRKFTYSEGTTNPVFCDHHGLITICSAYGYDFDPCNVRPIEGQRIIEHNQQEMLKRGMPQSVTDNIPKQFRVFNRQPGQAM